MKVSELATELGVPASAVLEQCQRFSIDASWAGAELSGTDLVVLRAELAAADAAIDLRSADELDEDGIDAGGTGEAEAVPGDDVRGAAHPPTAALSIPGAADPSDPAHDEHRSGFDFAGASGIADVDATATGPRASNVSDEDRKTIKARVEYSVRASLVALAIGIVAMTVAELVSNAWSIWALWVVAAIALVVALWNGNKGRRHVTMHPEKVKGLALSVIVMVVAFGGLVVVGGSAYASMGSSPAAAAPAGLGRRTSVDSARWGYHRLRRVMDESWRRPVKEVGTCWVDSPDKERTSQRIEYGTDRERCEDAHTGEVIDVYAFDRNADSPYPGRTELEADGRERCAQLAQRLLSGDGDEGDGPVRGVLGIEVPTKSGWENADHDVACILLTSERTGRLGSS